MDYEDFIDMLYYERKIFLFSQHRLRIRNNFWLTNGLVFYKRSYTYKMQALYEFFEDNTDCRVQFWELIMCAIDGNKISLKQKLFSDDATFTLNGHIDKGNINLRYGSLWWKLTLDERK